ncbi:MAG: NADH-quinone oxidoreductase subunit C [Ignavibacteria bacterium]|nr:NADH-quinone oxidoreductase subunit C [Ignavibacteria bacterium]
MSNEELKNIILQITPDAELTEEGSEFLNATVKPDQLHFLAEKLRNDKNTLFDYLYCLTGVDWISNFQVVYHLESTVHNHRIVLKAKITDRENPSVDTVSDIWKTAEFHEREVYDLFGIKFNNHPDLRRILLEEDWKGYPLRKDYADEANIVEL